MVVFALPACSMYGDYVSPYDYQDETVQQAERQNDSAEYADDYQYQSDVQHPAQQDVSVPVSNMAPAASEDEFDNLVWNEWQPQDITRRPDPVDAGVLTPLPTQAEAPPPIRRPVQAERVQTQQRIAPQQRQQAMPAPQEVNSSITIYPIDEVMPAEMARSNGNDFWQVMTIDSSGVNLDQYTPPQFDGSAAAQAMQPQYAANVPGDVYSIYFKHGSARLSAKELKDLKAMAAKARNQGRYLIRVTGYASSQVYKQVTEIEKQVVNLNMGGVRATRVSAALMRHGVPVQNIETVSRGAGFAGNDPKRDRRVDVEILGQ